MLVRPRMPRCRGKRSSPRDSIVRALGTGGTDFDDCGSGPVAVRRLGRAHQGAFHAQTRGRDQRPRRSLGKVGPCKCRAVPQPRTWGNYGRYGNVQPGARPADPSSTGSARPVDREPAVSAVRPDRTPAAWCKQLGFLAWRESCRAGPQEVTWSGIRQTCCAARASRPNKTLQNGSSETNRTAP